MGTGNDWSLAGRVAKLHQWKKRSKASKPRHVKNLVAGKQGTVAVVQDNTTKLNAVAKTTRFKTTDHIEAVRRWKANKKGQVQPEGLIEYRIWTVLSQLVMKKKCPNFVLLWETDIASDGRQMITYSEVWDKTLWTLSKNSQIGKTVFLPERAWVSMFFQICAGLLALHDAGIQHQDLHANNIFIKAVPKHDGYWAYHIGGKTYYCPNFGYVIAISDYGRALSRKHKVRSSFQTAVDDDLSQGVTNEFYDLERIFYSIQDKTRKYEFFTDLDFTEAERRARRPLAKIIPRLFDMYRTKPTSGKLLDSFRL